MFYRKHQRVSFNSGDRLITKQSHKDECDIHRILRQYQRTGVMTHVQRAQAQFLDLPDSLDYQTSLNSIMEANASFNSLPAMVRDYFKNNPANFLAAFSDPSQADKLREFGFLNPKASEPSGGDPVAPPPTQ